MPANNLSYSLSQHPAPPARNNKSRTIITVAVLGAVLALTALILSLTTTPVADQIPSTTSTSPSTAQPTTPTPPVPSPDRTP